MTDFIPRTCTEVREDGDGTENSSRSFEEFRNADAYVLLGAPGAGKTTAFKQEAEQSSGRYVTARDFITFDDRQEWHGTTLFIDGLDERRAGSADGRTPLDEIRNRLDRLGCPRFRLSCREADWFGANDRTHLKEVSKNGDVKVLRLDPLNEEDIHKILRDQKVKDPEGFVEQAREQGLETLLGNPQSLRMLVDAVGSGAWPETRKEVYELACFKLAGEFNEEHQLATQEQIDPSMLLEAAGRLCAVQLLAGHAGYALIGGASNEEYPGVEHVPFDNGNARHAAVRTKLFVSSCEGRTTPVHRHVAEFLGARHLAGMVENGLPVRRILALMTGDDGGVVSELRGLSAWLATHSKTSRMEIIERDPIGTVLYGDVKGFSPDEKRRLIDGLHDASRKNPWSSLEMDSRFGDLATPDMEGVFREALTNGSRDETHQGFVVFLIEALRHGPTIPGLTDVLLGVVKDESWWPRIKHRALDTVIHQGQNDRQTGAKLMALLADVHKGSVPDPDDELLGLLLSTLYPSKLSVSEILQYLRTPKDRNLFGMYQRFCTRDVATNSTNAQRAELLDILVERADELWEGISKNLHLSRLPSLLLAHSLKTSHENIASDRLFGWLDIAASCSERHGLHPQAEVDIHVWLSEHPETQKAIIATCVEHCRGEQPFDLCVDRRRHRLLFNATPPPDFGSWCLEQAIATDENAATYYTHRVADALYNHRHDEGLTQEIVEERLTNHPALKQAFRGRLSKWESEWERRDIEKGRSSERHKKQKCREQQQSRDFLKQHVAALRENRCLPSLLDQLATAYFGEFIEGDNPRDRLLNLLGDDADLVETVLVGLRGTINRNDIPTDTEIIRLRDKNQRHFLERPFMAGLEELSEPEREPPLNEWQMRQAVAFYYSSRGLSHYKGEKPHWYRWLLSHRPDVVSDVLIRFVRSEIRNGKEYFSEVPNLVKEHEVVARLVSLPLLERFPMRCTSPQLYLLESLLIAALLHCEKEAFLHLIERKLAFPSMNVAQRVYWLAAGLFASPASYCETLKASVSGRERRIRHLAEFLTGFGFGGQSVWAMVFDRLDVQGLELLIRLLGGSYRPFSYAPEVFSYDTTRMMTENLVTGLINRLATLPPPDATAALESLASDESLRPWRFTLVNEASRQHAIRREASFQHKDIPTVLRTLDNRNPANAADLAALTFDCLHEIARNILDGNTSDWRQYWNMNSKNQPEMPKYEDHCRDALLSDLRLKLGPLEIDAQPEGRYADEKRADVRVSYNGFNIPVEIKKSDHRELWSAVKTQLITKYTRDPGADGYGIYLVFWFGEQHCQMPHEGARPTSAHELQESLLNTLSAEEKVKVSICVIDVSKR